jgi:hypothetical protein
MRLRDLASRTVLIAGSGVMLALATPQAAHSQDTCDGLLDEVTITATCPSTAKNPVGVTVTPLEYCREQGEEGIWVLQEPAPSTPTEIVVKPKTPGRWPYRRPDGTIAKEHRAPRRIVAQNMSPSASLRSPYSYTISLTMNCTIEGQEELIEVSVDPKIKIP